MRCVVSSHQDLSGDTQYAVIVQVCLTIRSSVHFVHNEQKLTSTTPQHNRKHNRAPCPTAPSAHASYKGYGFDNAKPLRAPPRNTMMDVVVLGCGPIRTGKGAAAPFIGVHILGKIRPAGGFEPWPNRDGRTELDHLSRSKKSTIPQSTVGGIFVFGESAVGRNGGPVCGDGN
jgi:hypothetical protein